MKRIQLKNSRTIVLTMFAYAKAQQRSAKLSNKYRILKN